MKEIIIKEIQILEGGAFVTRSYGYGDKHGNLTDIKTIKQPWQILKLTGVYYKDGILVLHKIQYLEDKEIKEK